MRTLQVLEEHLGGNDPDIDFVGTRLKDLGAYFSRIMVTHDWADGIDVEVQDIYVPLIKQLCQPAFAEGKSACQSHNNYHVLNPNSGYWNCPASSRGLDQQAAGISVAVANLTDQPALSAYPLSADHVNRYRPKYPARTNDSESMGLVSSKRRTIGGQSYTCPGR